MLAMELPVAHDKLGQTSARLACSSKDHSNVFKIPFQSHTASRAFSAVAGRTRERLRVRAAHQMLGTVQKHGRVKDKKEDPVDPGKGDRINTHPE